MITYRLKDNVVTHFPTIFKGLGSKPSVIHMALDVELHGGVLVARVAGNQPIDCGKCTRSTVVELARELIQRSIGWCWWRRRADLDTLSNPNCASSEWRLLW
jgi:hypothetical protein